MKEGDLSDSEHVLVVGATPAGQKLLGCEAAPKLMHSFLKCH